MKNFTKILCLCLAVCLCLCFAGCGEKKDTVKIGVQTTTTGDIYASGDFGEDAVTRYDNGAAAIVCFPGIIYQCRTAKKCLPMPEWISQSLYTITLAVLHLRRWEQVHTINISLIGHWHRVCLGDYWNLE